jgi:hypothetical protein
MYYFNGDSFSPTANSSRFCHKCLTVPAMQGYYRLLAQHQKSKGADEDALALFSLLIAALGGLRSISRAR